ncbi:MAG: OmpA family protein [Saprospiraceae bacterium]
MNYNTFGFVLKIVLLILLFPFGMFGQSNNYTPLKSLSPKYLSIFKSSIQDSRIGAYEKSLAKINKILKVYPNCVEAQLKKAGTVYLLKDTDKALEILNDVIKNYPDYDIEPYFTRGFILFENKNYTLSTKDFKHYLSVDTLSINRRKKVTQYYEMSYFRDSLMRNPVKFTPTSLPKEVNSPYAEYSPSLSIDGTSLVFTRRFNHQEDLFISYIDSLGGFTNAQPLEQINTPSNEGAHCVSADGKLILFTGCDRDILFRGCDLYYSVLKNGSWTKPSNIGKVINTPAWESQPCLSADNRTLFFVSDRVGGLGGRDIWYSTKNERDIWSAPTNIGDHINTNQDDETPFLHPDGKTLYWRSNGRLGMGDFDIYFAIWDEISQSWGEVKNLGYPINTEGNEGGLVVSLDGTKAYFGTDYFSKISNQSFNLDICSFNLPPFAKATPTSFVKIVVSDANTNLPLVADVQILNIYQNHLFYTGITNTEGQLITPIHGKNKYSIHINKNGYLFYSAHIDIDSIFTFDKPYEYTVHLHAISEKETEAVVLNNLFFTSGSYQLLPESEREINMLYELLMTHKNIKILIIGHTDNVGQSVDNQILSFNRAQAVKDALIQKGISEERILVEGKGQNSPIDTNETPGGRKNNRRTEFKVVGKK